MAGLLKDRLEKAREKAEDLRESVKALCEPVELPRDSLAYQHFFCGTDTADPEMLKENEPKRVALYKLVGGLLRAYADVANEMAEAGYTPTEAQKIKSEVELYDTTLTDTVAMMNAVT